MMRTLRVENCNWSRMESSCKKLNELYIVVCQQSEHQNILIGVEIVEVVVLAGEGVSGVETDLGKIF